MLTIHAPAKVNIFLKITGTAPHPSGKNYHTILSRFVQVPALYDTISFVPCRCERFTVEGVENVALENNTVYKAYTALNAATGDLDLIDFFYHHKVVIKKRIPSGAGLGGGSSDAAAFLKLAKKACNLLIDTPELARIGAQIGADVPFFAYGYPSANVSGFGEIIEAFEETPPSLEIATPPIHCETEKVYKAFKAMRLPHSDPATLRHRLSLPSATILEEFTDPFILNDLLKAALEVCPKLKHTPYLNEGWFFSGSGSSFFRPVW